jgi:hypothetical protein
VGLIGLLSLSETKPTSWPEKLLIWCELIVIFVVFVWTMLGAGRFLFASGATLEGLLGAIDKNWKGALILSSLLFYRTLHEILARVKRFRNPWADFERQDLPIDGNATILPLDGKAEIVDK